MLTFEAEPYAEAQEHLVFVRFQRGIVVDRALFAAFSSKEAAEELADFLNSAAIQAGFQPSSCG